MKTILVRLGIGIMLTCIVGMLAGCAGQPTQAKSAPVHATFVIAFQPNPPAKPTGMAIQPDDGNVVLEVVKRPGPDDNKVVWQSDQKFGIRSASSAIRRNHSLREVSLETRARI